MPQFDTPRDLLESLLRDEPLTPGALDEIIAEHKDEGQFHDFKSGSLLDDPPRAGRFVRKYLSAFANSEGGALIIGVAEPSGDDPRAVDGCKKPGGQTELTEWAANVLGGMVGEFSPPPRFQTVSHNDGEVLVCAVARAPALISVIESGQRKYYLRMGDTTRECPEYLISDLVLGRRQHPVFRVALVGVTQLSGRSTQDSAGTNVSVLAFGLVIDVENVSFHRAEDARVGIISWAPNGAGVVESLQRYIDKGSPEHYSERNKLDWELKLGKGVEGAFGRPTFQVDALSETRVHVYEALELPAYVNECKPIASAALFVLPKGSPPSWFQLRVSSIGFSPANDPEAHAQNAARIARLAPSSRPLVDWKRVGTID